MPLSLSLPLPLPLHPFTPYSSTMPIPSDTKCTKTNKDEFLRLGFTSESPPVLRCRDADLSMRCKRGPRVPGFANEDPECLDLQTRTRSPSICKRGPRVPRFANEDPESLDLQIQTYLGWADIIHHNRSMET
uniref:uncharacterized protein LOC101307127 isoform X2 n=1 Tax=Fragaria vesca subsp. vesca TaxID=101020 RepID=UPI0005CB26D3|nr:PREDICTED: uncharacterized protein LOC101307127 isoform X2 [Fragaria vesca subsp. vesca]